MATFRRHIFITDIVSFSAAAALLKDPCSIGGPHTESFALGNAVALAHCLCVCCTVSPSSNLAEFGSRHVAANLWVCPKFPIT